MRPLLRKEFAGDDGWTRWVRPVMRGYLFTCCDCRLVHHLEFRVHKGHVQFRAKLAPRYTAAERKRIKKSS